MGQIYQNWQEINELVPSNFGELREILHANRKFEPIDKLEFGDHGLESALNAIYHSIKAGKRIALYADYDVDGTMSCVSWIWFFQQIGYDNYTFYIPDRFREGYGLNLDAVKHLVEERGAEVVITMDTGITANTEASWCKENGVLFICTDHHVIQPSKMPDCIILNPKNHPDPNYQELCGCGITFVLLRQLGQKFDVSPSIWTDLLALAGMATICDLVPLNGVNHRLARYGVEALLRSQKPILKALRKACASTDGSIDEVDVGFRVGPRINAVGRLYHANEVVKAFIDDSPDELVRYMDKCNDERKKIQNKIIAEATEQAKSQLDAPILFLGSENWHEGVVGIAASKLADDFWRPVFLYKKGEKICKGSARSIPKFDVTGLMMKAGHSFSKFGGHPAAGGFSFELDKEDLVRESLLSEARKLQIESPNLWESVSSYDCMLPAELLEDNLLDCLQGLKPYGLGYEIPKFRIKAQLARVQYYKCKQTSEPKHTCLHVETPNGIKKVVFFHRIFDDLVEGHELDFLAEVHKNVWQGRVSLQMIGCDLH